MFRDLAERFADFKGRIVFVGRAPNTNLACYERPNYLQFPCPPLNLSEFAPFRAAFDRFSATTKLDVVMIDPVDTICPDNSCRLADADGHVLYTDETHLSVYGAQEIVPQILHALAMSHSVRAISLDILRPAFELLFHPVPTYQRPAEGRHLVGGEDGCDLSNGELGFAVISGTQN